VQIFFYELGSKNWKTAAVALCYTTKRVKAFIFLNILNFDPLWRCISFMSGCFTEGNMPPLHI
jgi:hypothetical protein